MHWCDQATTSLCPVARCSSSRQLPRSAGEEFYALLALLCSTRNPSKVRQRRNSESLTRELELEELPPHHSRQGALERSSDVLFMPGSPLKFLEVASVVGRKACGKSSKMDPADPPLRASRPISRGARLACAHTYSLKRVT